MVGAWRWARPWIAVIVATLTFGGCAAANPARVTLLLAGDPAEIAAYRRVIDAFHATSPGVTVELLPAADRDAMLTRLSTSIAAGTPPDLFLLNYRFFAQYAAKGALEPIEDRLRASVVLDETAFFPEAIDAFRYEGKLTCLAQNVSSLVVYYNRDLFAAAGLEEPPDAWTWDDMIETARALTKDIDGDGAFDQHGLGAEPILARLAPFVWSNGGEIVDDVANPTAISLRSPEASSALLRFLELGAGTEPGTNPGPGVVVGPSDQEVEAEDLESRFANGTLGMYLSSRRSTPTFRTIEAFDWDVAPLPVLQEPAGVLHADGYCLTAGSKAKDAAWRFVEFALGAEGQRITAASGRTVPSLREVALSDAFLDPSAKPSRSKVFTDGIDSLRAFPLVATWPEIERAADEVIEQGMYGEISIEELVTLLEERTADAFARDGG
ncbi:MAG TPA: sugar ABC transporter substrate-binding protein [Candidatus Limnocylindrales bacterium]|nr:sugar ABC transporter substrate-binding protein [Candidatus Limnocylindrales bacterium]